MNTSLAFVPKQQFLDIDGNPLSSGRVQYFDATTSTPKAVYSDRAGTVPHTEVLLDAGGSPLFGGLWYGEGVYKVVVQKLISEVGPTYQTLYTVDNVDGAAVPVVGSQRVLFIEAVINLPAVDSSLYDIVFCSGYYSVGDGGGGQFVWNGTTAAPADGGIVIKPTSLPAIGAWLRNVPAGEIPAAYWGYLSLLPAQAMESRLVAAHTFCSNYERVLLLQCGKTAIGHASSVTLTGGFIHIETGYHIQRMASAPAMITLTFQDVDLEIDGKQTLTKDIHTANVVINCKMPVIYPEWWGADPYATNDSYFGIYGAQVTSNYGGGVEIAFNGQYLCTGLGYTVLNLDLPNISMTSTSWIEQTTGIILHKVSAPQVCSEIFREPTGEFSKWDCSDVEKTYAEWFLQGTPTDLQIIEMCKTVTKGNTIKGTIYWNYGGTWVLPNVADDLACSLVTQIPESSKWMDNGTTIQMANGVLYPEYWLNNNIQAAMLMAGRNKAWVDGRNNEYNMITPLSTTSCADTVRMRNMIITGLIVFDTAGPGVILKDSTFNSVTFTASANAWVANIQNCNFFGEDGVNFGLSTSKLTVKGCTIDGFSVVNFEPCRFGVITGNIFENIILRTIINGTNGDGCIAVTDNNFVNMNGLGLDTNPLSYGLILQTPNNMRFTNNYCEVLPGDSPMDIVHNTIVNGDITKPIISNFICNNNTFNIEGLGLSTRPHILLSAMNCADYGHGAIVKDNTTTVTGSIGVELRGTEAYTRRAVPNAGSTGLTPSFKLMLPKYQNRLTKWTYTVDNGGTNSLYQQADVVSGHANVLPFVQALVSIGTQADGIFTFQTDYYLVIAQGERSLYISVDCGFNIGS